MKFQVKALVAALAVIASVPAQAATDSAVSGNSSMMLVAFDVEANVSAAFDLGKNYSDFNVIGASFADSNVDALGTSFSWNLAAGDYATAWNTLLPLVTPANLQWAVIGGDAFGAGTGQISFIGTLNQEALATIRTSLLATQVGTIDTYLSNVGVVSTQVVSNHNSVANGANVSNSATTADNFVNYLKTGMANGRGSMVTGSLDQSLAVFQQISAATNTVNSTGAIFANNAAFRLTSNGALTYSTDPLVTPVPEADSWAMMLLGLGFMGFAARRKQS